LIMPQGVSLFENHIATLFCSSCVVFH